MILFLQSISNLFASSALILVIDFITIEIHSKRNNVNMLTGNVIMLEKLEKLSAQIIALQEQAINLTIDYRKR